MSRHGLVLAALAIGLTRAACTPGRGSLATPGPGAGTPAPGASTGGGATPGPLAGEPCSFLTAEQVTTIVGTAPVEIAERAGRGDCDYWLDAAKTQKINIGVTTGADGAALFESTKALGEFLPVPNLGDDAYMQVLEGLGTIVVAKQGDSVVSVQLLNTMDSAEQAIRVINLAREVVKGL